MISVIMPVYNAEKYIEEAVKSILNQTYKNFELIIIDDGSTDKGIEIVKNIVDERIKIFKNECNMGLPYTRQRGMSLATGKYIALMDSDDISYKKRFEKQIEILEENEEWLFVSSYVDLLIEGKVKKDKKIFLKNYIGIYDELKISTIFGNNISNSAAMIRREAIKKNVIEYRKECFVAQDYAFWVDCLERGKGKIIKESLLAYRTGHENISKKSTKKNPEKRREVINEIRVRALKNNGIYLSEKEQECICDVFADPKKKLRYLEYSNGVEILNKSRENIGKATKVVFFEIGNKIADSEIRVLEKIKLIRKIQNKDYKIYGLLMIKIFLKGISFRGRLQE